MQTPQIARILDEMGTLLEIRGENAFRCRAYHNAAEALRGLPADLSGMLEDGSLAEVPGIGATMLAKIGQMLATGRLSEYEALKAETPPSLAALLKVPGLGPKKIRALYDELKVESLADLRAAAESGRVAKLKGFGPKAAEKILAGIGFVESVGDRMLLSRALRLSDGMVAILRGLPGVTRAEAAGSVRRRAETVGDLDLLIAAEDPTGAMGRVLAVIGPVEVLERGPDRAGVRLSNGSRCDVRVVPDAAWPVALVELTGSAAHVAELRERAKARGLTWTEMGGKGAEVADEAGVYGALGLAFIPPELREGRGEVEAAAAGRLPRLIERLDLTGTFHCHTDWSDGGASLEEMAEAARAAGLHYLGIADHSRSAGYAGGLSIDRVKRQWEAIDALNERFGGAFRVLKGTECDILADGSLDYPDDVLAGFDYVVASVHSQFGLPRGEMTARICRAVASPFVTMLGHPTGRLLLAREAYAVDLDAVIDAATGSGAMIEINANPHRLDLDADHCRKARARGVPIAINPDAHATGGFADLDYGVWVARRAGLEPADVVNAAPPAEVFARLEARRAAAR